MSSIRSLSRWQLSAFESHDRVRSWETDLLQSYSLLVPGSCPVIEERLIVEWCGDNGVELGEFGVGPGFRGGNTLIAVTEPVT